MPAIKSEGVVALTACLPLLHMHTGAPGGQRDAGAGVRTHRVSRGARTAHHQVRLAGEAYCCSMQQQQPGNRQSDCLQQTYPHRVGRSTLLIY